DTPTSDPVGALPDITLSRHTSSTLKDVWLLTTTPAAPEPTSRNAEAALTSILPTVEKHEEGEPVLVAVDTGLTARDKEMEVTTRPRETTQLPITQRVSTVRATTAQAVTSHAHRDVQPGLHETLVPTAPGQSDHQPPSATEGGTSVIKEVVEDGATNQLPTGEGSGEQDFTFETSGENTAVAAIEPDQRNQQPVDEGATGASQGLLDRKEVLGGVIAGGLVGLIFAVCLVAFMLYRMKKKDEGSYSLEEPKQANGGAYQKPTKQEEFYA
ncbi:SDC1, partial [Lemmus lemmus]